MPTATTPIIVPKASPITRLASDEVLANPALAEQLAERLEALDRFDLDFLTSTLNDDLIQQGSGLPPTPWTA